MSAHDGQISTRIMIRPLGSGLPLGFFSFAVGMLMLAAQGIGWIPPSSYHMAGLMLITFVAPLEFTGAIVAFFARDTIGATTLGVFSGSWFASGWALYAGAPGSVSPAFGFFLAGFGTVVFMLCIVSAPAKPLFAVILFGSTARMGWDSAYQLTSQHWLLVAAGWTAFALFLIAIYGGLALALEDIQREEVLPVFRRGAARQALEGSLEDQLARIESDPGVRQQL